ncbi:hypothetical protein Tco_0456606 [Tanacetum coccineum]
MAQLVVVCSCRLHCRLGTIGCCMLLSASLSTSVPHVLCAPVVCDVQPRRAFQGVRKAISWCGVYTNATMVVFLARPTTCFSGCERGHILEGSDDDALLFTAHSLPRLVSWLGSHTDNVSAAVVDSG